MECNERDRIERVPLGKKEVDVTLWTTLLTDPVDITFPGRNYTVQ